MPTLLDYRRRIRSVKNTQQITRAMKFVAAVEAAARAGRACLPRGLTRGKFCGCCVRPRRVLRVPRIRLLERRPEQRILAIVLDRRPQPVRRVQYQRGAALARIFTRESREKIEVIAVGKKGRDTLRKRGWSFVAEYLGVSDRVEFGKAKEIAARVAEIYRRAKSMRSMRFTTNSKT